MTSSASIVPLWWEGKDQRESNSTLFLLTAIRDVTRADPRTLRAKEYRILKNDLSRLQSTAKSQQLRILIVSLTIAGKIATKDFFGAFTLGQAMIDNMSFLQLPHWNKVVIDWLAHHTTMSILIELYFEATTRAGESFTEDTRNKLLVAYQRLLDAGAQLPRPSGDIATIIALDRLSDLPDLELYEQAKLELLSQKGQHLGTRMIRGHGGHCLALITRYPNFALKLILPLVEHSISEVTNRLLLADQKSTDMELLELGTIGSAMMSVFSRLVTSTEKISQLDLFFTALSRFITSSVGSRAFAPFRSSNSFNPLWYYLSYLAEKVSEVPERYCHLEKLLTEPLYSMLCRYASSQINGNSQLGVGSRGYRERLMVMLNDHKEPVTIRNGELVSSALKTVAEEWADPSWRPYDST